MSMSDIVNCLTEFAEQLTSLESNILSEAVRQASLRNAEELNGLLLEYKGEVWQTADGTLVDAEPYELQMRLHEACSLIIAWAKETGDPGAWPAGAAETIRRAAVVKRPKKIEHGESHKLKSSKTTNGLMLAIMAEGNQAVEWTESRWVKELEKCGHAVTTEAVEQTTAWRSNVLKRGHRENSANEAACREVLKP